MQEFLLILNGGELALHFFLRHLGLVIDCLLRLIGTAPKQALAPGKL